MLYSKGLRLSLYQTQNDNSRWDGLKWVPRHEYKKQFVCEPLVNTGDTTSKGSKEIRIIKVGWITQTTSYSRGVIGKID